MALDFLPRRWSKRKILQIGKDLVEWMRQPQNRWLGKFCAEHGFHRQRLPEFCEEYPTFKKYYQIAKQMQEDKLIDLVIDENTNAGFVTFLLKNISRDLRDKHDIELSGAIKQKIAHGDIKKMSKDEVREFLRSELSKDD